VALLTLVTDQCVTNGTQLFNGFECTPPHNRKTVIQQGMTVAQRNKYKVKSWPITAFYDAATELI